MTRLTYFIWCVFILVVPLRAQVISGSSPLIPDRYEAIRLREPLPQATVKMDGLKAVLVAAPIDGDGGSWTLSEIDHLKQTARTLRENGVTVYEFYTPDNAWSDIRQKAEGAHFLMYRGHGVYDGSEPPKWVGGFALKEDFVSPASIRSELKLAPRAIVMLYGCFTAGNAGSDIGRIDLAEAKRRVALYAEPFFKAGVSGYYANWYGDAFQHFVAHLFAGKTLGQAYKAYADFGEETVSYDRLPDADVDMWIDHDDWDGKMAYNNAFVGESGRTLKDLFSYRKEDHASTGTQTAKLSGASSNAKGASMSYLTPLEKEVFYELNRVRRNPRGYANYVKELLPYFDGNLLNYPGEISLVTQEGAAAVKECYDALLSAQPLDSLRPSRGLSMAARDHVEDQGETASTGHDGSDGSSPFDRMERYGAWLKTAGENIDYGNQNARRIVLSLLIDDGVPSRGHRANILNPDFKAVGIACGPHKRYRYMCVMDLAGGFKAKSNQTTTRGDDESDE